MDLTPSAQEIARPLPDEIVREAVVALLDLRWQRAVTLVTAPGGYGKTRALAQAVRSNNEDPVGEEFYLRLRPAHVDASTFAKEVCERLGGEAGESTSAEELAARIIEQLASWAPTGVCLLLDDMHLLSDGAPAVEVLKHVARSLPANAHLVLAGRVLPQLPLARLRADGSVLDVGPAELAFVGEEVALLAGRYDIDPQALEDLAGWPALVRLAVVSGKSGPSEFLLQEILEDLPAAVQHALGVASLAGCADEELLQRCGIDDSFDVLRNRVPLIDVLPDGLIRPHDMWREVSERASLLGDRSDVARVVAQWHGEHQRFDDALAVAVGAGQDELARSLLMDALSHADISVTPALTARWLALFNVDSSFDGADPELLLLRGWHARLAHGPGHGDQDVAHAVMLFQERGDVHGEARARVEHAFRGFLAGDAEPVIAAVTRGAELKRAGALFPRALGALTNAVIAELSGDFKAAVKLARQGEAAGASSEFAELARRHLTMLYILSGDAEGTLDAADHLVKTNPTADNKVIRLLARFAVGRPEELLEDWENIRYYRSGNLREDFTIASASVLVDTCLGITPDLTFVHDTAWDRPREQILVALCEWSAQILAGDEASGNATLDRRVNELGLDDPLVVGEVRRYLVACYVASPAARAMIEEPSFIESLGPRQVDQLQLARRFMALRQGKPARAESPTDMGFVLSSMSLPWAVEFACLLSDRDNDAGSALAEALLAAAGAPAHQWFRTIAAGESVASASAARFLRSLPATPAHPTRIVTQGVIQIERASETHEVRRARVRQLLLMLLLRPSLNRDAITQMLWPDKAPDKARNNLRITLSHLRDEIEPDRNAGEPSFHLLQRGNEISLRRSAHLSADLWDIAQGLAGAEAAAQRGERAARLEELETITDLWRAPFLPELADVSEMQSDVAALHARLRDATIDSAQALHANGEFARAETLGRKLLVEHPFDERAHTVVIAALHDAAQHAAAAEAVAELQAALDEMGVDPAPATRMLLRRVSHGSSGLLSA